MPELTPSQTIGPFFRIGLAGCEKLVEASNGTRPVTVHGMVIDGASVPMTDALVEIWQADAAGRYRHPEDPGAAFVQASFDGFGRSLTDAEGRFSFTTVMPGCVASGRLR